MDLLRQPIEMYLRFKIGREVVVEECTKFPRGSSRETWFVSYRVGSVAQPTKVIFRCDHPGGSTIPTSLEQEYFMYDRLGRTAVPVAKVLWWEDDAQWAARPFFVREQVDGSWELPDFLDPDPSFDEYRIEISKEHLRKLALVHTLDWKALGFDQWLPAPADVADCGANMVRIMRAQMAAIGGEKLPIFVLACDWLLKHAPAAPRISLCKGTNGLGEEVFQDGQIVAMSDWEEASIGDPAADFAYMQNFIPVVQREGHQGWGLAQALDYYRSVSGIHVTEEAVSYYGALRAVTMLVMGRQAARIAHLNPDAHIRQVWTGVEVLHLGKTIVGSILGLSAPAAAERMAEMNVSVA